MNGQIELSGNKSFYCPVTNYERKFLFNQADTSHLYIPSLLERERERFTNNDTQRGNGFKCAPEFRLCCGGFASFKFSDNLKYNTTIACFVCVYDIRYGIVVHVLFFHHPFTILTHLPRAPTRETKRSLHTNDHHTN